MKTPRSSPHQRRPPADPRRTNFHEPGGPGMSDLALAINRIACDGYGSCAELLPEMIELDDWGYPILRPGPVPNVLVPHAQMAVDTCPVLALRLVAAARATMAPAAIAPTPNAPAGGVRAGGPARARNR